MDEVGVDGLTMRRLADRLGVTAASLYRHVRDKDEVLVLLADEISGEVPMVAGDAPWQQALRDMAHGYRRVLLAHRDAARVLAATPPAGPRRLRHIEAMLRVLQAAGFSPREATWAGYHFNNLVTEFVADEVRLATAADAAGLTPDDLRAGARAQIRALPPDEFPCLIASANDVASDDADGLFAFGLDVWLSGLERLRPERRD